MSQILQNDKSASKCFVLHGILPQYIDPKQPPSKKKPFATILNQPMNHTVMSLGHRELMLTMSSYLDLGRGNPTRGAL